MVFPSEFPSHRWSKIAPGTTGVGAGFRAGGSGRSFSGLAIGVPNDLTPHDLGWLMVKNYPCEDELFWGVVWLNEIIKIDMFLEDIKSYPPIHHLIYRRFCSNVITEPSGEGPSHFFFTEAMDLLRVPCLYFFGGRIRRSFSPPGVLEFLGFNN